jgi:hypothetical protein
MVMRLAEAPISKISGRLSICAAIELTLDQPIRVRTVAHGYSDVPGIARNRNGMFP